MKIQINGFDIEVNTEESNLAVKVLDANGKELSNNTYNQSSTTGDEIKPVEMPSAENTEPTSTEQPAEQSTEENPVTGESTPAENNTEAPQQGDVTDANTDIMGEGFVPDFETFKKLRSEGKI